MINTTTSHPDTNPNSSWLSLRGTWLTNVLIVVVLKIAFSLVPGITTEVSWTLTNLTYNIVTFFFFHWLMGTPFDTNQNEYANLTLWEQIDQGQQFTPTRKFLTTFPVILFLLSTHYSRYDIGTFTLNFFALVPNLVGKLPSMYGVRLFGINKKEMTGIESEFLIGRQLFATYVLTGLLLQVAKLMKLSVILTALLAGAAYCTAPFLLKEYDWSKERVPGFVAPRPAATLDAEKATKKTAWDLAREAASKKDAVSIPEKHRLEIEEWRAKYDFYTSVSEKNYQAFFRDLEKLQASPDRKDHEKAGWWEWYHAAKIQAAHDMVREIDVTLGIVDRLGESKVEERRGLIGKLDVEQTNLERLEKYYKELSELGYIADENLAAAMARPKPALLLYRTDAQ